MTASAVEVSDFVVVLEVPVWTSAVTGIVSVMTRIKIRISSCVEMSILVISYRYNLTFSRYILHYK